MSSKTVHQVSKMQISSNSWLTRTVLTAVPKQECCDICNPKLFDQVRPSKPVRPTRQKGIRKGPPSDVVRQALFTWRREIKKMEYPHAIFAPHAILDDATCELLASIGPVEDIQVLEQLLQSSWSRWDALGNRLYVYMHGLNIPPLPPPPPRKKAVAATPQTLPASNSQSVPHPNSTTSKRRHPAHSTPGDESGPPARRLRVEPSSQIPHTPRPTPTPAYRAFPAQLPHTPLPASTFAYAYPARHRHHSPPRRLQPCLLPTLMLLPRVLALPNSHTITRITAIRTTMAIPPPNSPHCLILLLWAQILASTHILISFQLQFDLRTPTRCRRLKCRRTRRALLKQAAQHSHILSPIWKHPAIPPNSL